MYTKNYFTNRKTCKTEHKLNTLTTDNSIIMQAQNIHKIPAQDTQSSAANILKKEKEIVH